MPACPGHRGTSSSRESASCSPPATGLFVLNSKSGTTNLSFWFESIGEDARKTLPGRLPDGLSPDDMKVIEAMSREEIVRAFRTYPISIVGRASALYHVRVVDSLNSPYGGSAESYAFPGLVGSSTTVRCGGTLQGRCCGTDLGWIDYVIAADRMSPRYRPKTSCRRRTRKCRGGAAAAAAALGRSPSM